MNLFLSFLTTTTQKLMDGVIILETETLGRESFPLVVSIGTITLLFLIASIARVIRHETNDVWIIREKD